MQISNSPFMCIKSRRSFYQRVLYLSSAVIALCAIAMAPISQASAATDPMALASAQSFAVLAGSTITNTGITSITGDVGSSPTNAITGFGTVAQTGTNHGGDSVTVQAKSDLANADTNLTNAGVGTPIGVELGGNTFTPGIYSSGTLGITGTVTLNTLGDPEAIFIFKAASTLTTASLSNVVVLGGLNACNVFWQVGSSATLGTGSHILGNIIATASITATTGVSVQGRLLAQAGAVTLDTNTITPMSCAPAEEPTTTTTTTVPTTTTEPETTTTTTVPVTTTTMAATTTVPTTTTTLSTTTTEPAITTTMQTTTTITPATSTVTTVDQAFEIPANSQSQDHQSGLETGLDTQLLAHTGLDTRFVLTGISLIFFGCAMLLITKIQRNIKL